MSREPFAGAGHFPDDLHRVLWAFLYGSLRADPMTAPPDADPPLARPKAARTAWVVALVAGGCLSCWAAFVVEQRLSAPTLAPDSREVTFDVVVTDADAGTPVPGAQVGVDMETGEYGPPPPTWKGVTDATGHARVVNDYNANAVFGRDGKARGRVVFTRGSAPHSFSDLLVVRASGYRERIIALSVEYPQGINYEDPAPRTIRVQLPPSASR